MTVAYGTSEDVGNCHPGELKVEGANRDAGPSLDTKFDLGNRVKLPFDTDWFTASPNKRFGDHPKRGVLDTADDILKRRLSSAIAELKKAERPKTMAMGPRPAGRKKRKP